MHQIKSDKRLKSVMINIFADTSFDFEKQEIIDQTTMQNLDADQATIYYQINFFDEFDWWHKGEQGCFICEYLINSNEE